MRSSLALVVLLIVAPSVSAVRPVVIASDGLVLQQGLGAKTHDSKEGEDNADSVDASSTMRMTMRAMMRATRTHIIRIAYQLAEPLYLTPLQFHGGLWSSMKSMPHLCVGVSSVPILLWVAASPGQSAWTYVVAWLYSNLAMNMANKAAADGFAASCLLVILQMVVGTLIVLAFEGRKLNYNGARTEDILKWCVVPFFFAGMLASSIYALKETTLSTVLILRSILPIFTLFAEKRLFNSPATLSTSIICSIMVCLVGTAIYGCTSLSVTPWAVKLILLNCVVTVADRLLQRSMLSSPNFSVSLPLCMIINNVCGIVPMLILAAVTGEVHTWGGILATSSVSSWGWAIASGFLGCCLGYLGLHCSKLFSATSILMLLNLNKVFVIFIGVLIFKDKFTTLASVGCSLALGGAIWYGYVRLPSETALAKDTEATRLCPVFIKGQAIIK